MSVFGCVARGSECVLVIGVEVASHCGVSGSDSSVIKWHPVCVKIQVCVYSAVGKLLCSLKRPEWLGR